MISKEEIKQFLEGDGPLKDLKYIRAIETAYWSNKANVFVRSPSEDKPSCHEYKFTPFLFSKKLDFNKHFKYRHVEIHPEKVTSGQFVYENKKYQIDGIDVKFVTQNIWTGLDVYRLLIKDIEDRKKFFISTSKIYGIKIKKLKINEKIPRLVSGFNYLISIEEQATKQHSENPLLKYKKNGALKNIQGSYSDLLNFFREGGINVYEQTGVFFNTKKTHLFWESLSDEGKFRFYLQTADLFKSTDPGLDIENFYAKHPNASNLLNIIKKKELKERINYYYASFKAPLTIKDSKFDEIEQYCILNAKKAGYSIKGGLNELYLSPDVEKINKLANGLVFLEGFLKAGDDWQLVETYLVQYLVDLKKEIPHYSVICLDEEKYKEVFHSSYENFKNFLVKSLSNIEKHKNTQPTQSLSPAQVYRYIDIIGMEVFMEHADCKKNKPEINGLFVPELNKNGRKNTFSFHNTICGRKFIDVCLKYKYEILDFVDPLFVNASPTSQFMMQSGARLFKGLAYDDLNILTLDIETEALEAHKHDKNAALDPNKAQVFYIGIKTTKGYTNVMHADGPVEEKAIIEETYKIINEISPDFIIGYSSEHFDFPFMERRLELLGCVKEDRDGKLCPLEYIRSLMPQKYGSNTIFPYYLYNKKEKSHLKVGGTTKEYTQTNIYGINIFDGIHQTMRLQAIDKRDSLSLKWNVKKEKIAKQDRVYVNGDKIGEIGKDKRTYFLNETNGDWFVNEIPIIQIEKPFENRKIKPDEQGNIFYENKRNLYINCKGPDELKQKCLNVLTLEHYEDISKFKNDIYSKIRDYDSLAIPKKRFGVAYKETNPLLYRQIISFLQGLGNDLKNLKNVYSHVDFEKYIEVDGKEIIRRYLLDDLWETLELFKKMGQSPFLLCSWIPTSAQKVFTMGNASMWKLLMMTWFYKKGLGIPDYEDYRKINGGLIGMFKSGYCAPVVKKDVSSQYPSVKLQYLPSPDWDITGVGDAFLDFFLDNRLDYKALARKYFKAMDLVMGQLYDILQSPLKIFINTYYGFLAAWNISPFSDMLTAHGITAISRSIARHIIFWYEQRGFEAIYAHTDGINFIYPQNAGERTYIGKGLNWLTVEGKEYKGLEAYVAEYNDSFMKGKLGIDIDDIDHSCINIAKSNVVHFKLKHDGKYEIKIVGGLIKKDTPNYIKNFLNDNLETLMLGNAYGFIMSYFDYVKRILDRKIKGIDIASKVKFKSLYEYKNVLKSKSAPYEAIIKYKVDIDPGTVFFYYNNGSEDRDSGTDKITIGKMAINGIPEEKIKNIISLLKNFDDKDKVKSIIDWFVAKDKFTWKKTRVDNKLVDDTSKKYLENITSWDGIAYKIGSKTNKKTGEIEKHIEIIMVKEVLNVKPLALEDHHSLIDYNPQKYLKSFYNAVEPLFLCFPPDLRELMAEGNMPLVTDDNIRLVNGIPLKDKEQNQQDKNEAMLIESIEMEFWKDSRLDPHWFLNNKKYGDDNYDISEDGKTIATVNKIGKIWHESKKNFT